MSPPGVQVQLSCLANPWIRKFPAVGVGEPSIVATAITMALEVAIAFALASTA